MDMVDHVDVICNSISRQQMHGASQDLVNTDIVLPESSAQSSCTREGKS
jgi:hypothetical protein